MSRFSASLYIPLDAYQWLEVKEEAIKLRFAVRGIETVGRSRRFATITPGVWRAERKRIRTRSFPTRWQEPTSPAHLFSRSTWKSPTNVAPFHPLVRSSPPRKPFTSRGDSGQRDVAHYAVRSSFIVHYGNERPCLLHFGLAGDQLVAGHDKEE